MWDPLSGPGKVCFGFSNFWLEISRIDDFSLDPDNSPENYNTLGSFHYWWRVMYNLKYLSETLSIFSKSIKILKTIKYVV